MRGGGGIQEGEAEVVNVGAGFAGWRVGLSSLWLSFPLCGNGLSKPLDSGLRRNDGGGCGQVFFENDKRVLRIASHLVLYSSSFQRRLESRERSRKSQRTAGFCKHRIVWPPCGGHSCYAGMNCLNDWIPRPLVPDAALPPASMQAGLRRNDGRGWIPAFAGMMAGDGLQPEPACLGQG